MKLKTVKDLDLHGCGVCDVDGVDIKELKDSAIKWVKGSEMKKDKHLENGNMSLALSHKTTIIWIKHFFNLTAEDLK